MIQTRRALLQGGLASLFLTPAAAQQAGQGLDLGAAWRVEEISPGNAYWDGVWRRRGQSQSFDAQWIERYSGQTARDVIDLEGFDGTRVTLFRRGINGRYWGDLLGGGAIRGSASWYDPRTYWTAEIRS